MSFFNIPANIAIQGTTIRLTGTNTPLTLFSAPTSQGMGPVTPFDTTTPHQTTLNPGLDTQIFPGDLMACVQNPANGAPTTFTAMAVNPNLAPTTGATGGGAIITNTMAQLLLPLGAIIGIAVGLFVFILLLIGGLFLYSKRQSKKKAEYKPVQQKDQSQSNQKEETDDSSEDDTTESEEEEEEEEEDDNQNDYDSYPPPRRSSSRGPPREGSSRGGMKGNRAPNRGPSRSRERSYSDDDDEDDYSSDDYS